MRSNFKFNPFTLKYCVPRLVDIESVIMNWRRKLFCFNVLLMHLHVFSST